MKLIFLSLFYLFYNFTPLFSAELLTVATGREGSLSYKFVKDLHQAIRYNHPRKDDEIDVFPTDSIEERIDALKRGDVQFAIIPKNLISPKDPFWILNKVYLHLWETKLYAFETVKLPNTNDLSSESSEHIEKSTRTKVLYAMSDDSLIQPVLNRFKKELLLELSPQNYLEKINSRKKGLFFKSYVHDFEQLQKVFNQNSEIQFRKLPAYMLSELNRIQPPYYVHKFKYNKLKTKTVAISYLLVAFKNTDSEILKEILIHLFRKKNKVFPKPFSFSLVQSKATSRINYEMLHPVTISFFNIKN